MARGKKIEKRKTPRRAETFTCALIGTAYVFRVRVVPTTTVGALRREIVRQDAMIRDKRPSAHRMTVFRASQSPSQWISATAFSAEVSCEETLMLDPKNSIRKQFNGQQYPQKGFVALFLKIPGLEPLVPSAHIGQDRPQGLCVEQTAIEHVSNDSIDFTWRRPQGLGNAVPPEEPQESGDAAPPGRPQGPANAVPPEEPQESGDVVVTTDFVSIDVKEDESDDENHSLQHVRRCTWLLWSPSQFWCWHPPGCTIPRLAHLHQP